MLFHSVKKCPSENSSKQSQVCVALLEMVTIPACSEIEVPCINYATRLCGYCKELGETFQSMLLVQ